MFGVSLTLAIILMCLVYLIGVAIALVITGYLTGKNGMSEEDDAFDAFNATFSTLWPIALVLLTIVGIIAGPVKAGIALYDSAREQGAKIRERKKALKENV